MRSVQIGKCYEKVCPHNFINLKALFLLKYFFFLSVHANNTIQKSYILFCKVFKQKVLKWLLLLHLHFLTIFTSKMAYKKAQTDFLIDGQALDLRFGLSTSPIESAKKTGHIFFCCITLYYGYLQRKSSTIWTIISSRKFYRNILQQAKLFCTVTNICKFFGK